MRTKTILQILFERDTVNEMNLIHLCKKTVSICDANEEKGITLVHKLNSIRDFLIKVHQFERSYTLDSLIEDSFTKMIGFTRKALIPNTEYRDCDESDHYFAQVFLEIIYPNVHESSINRLLKEYLLEHYNDMISTLPENGPIGKVRLAMNYLLQSIIKDEFQSISSLSCYK